MYNFLMNTHFADTSLFLALFPRDIQRLLCTYFIRAKYAPFHPRMPMPAYKVTTFDITRFNLYFPLEPITWQQKQ